MPDPAFVRLPEPEMLAATVLRVLLRPTLSEIASPAVLTSAMPPVVPDRPPSVNAVPEAFAKATEPPSSESVAFRRAFWFDTTNWPPASVAVPENVLDPEIASVPLDTAMPPEPEIVRSKVPP